MKCDSYNILWLISNIHFKELLQICFIFAISQISRSVSCSYHSTKKLQFYSSMLRSITVHIFQDFIGNQYDMFKKYLNLILCSFQSYNFSFYISLIKWLENLVRFSSTTLKSIWSDNMVANTWATLGFVISRYPLRWYLKYCKLFKSFDIWSKTSPHFLVFTG